MKKLLLIGLVFFAVISSRFLKSGLTIPAKQTFILGELNAKNYSAEFPYVSEFKVLITIQSKTSAQILNELELQPNQKIKLFISKDEIAYFKNDNEQVFKVSRVLNKGVEGMPYIKEK
tara:strand:- start:19447 stop:19800 length:354 start_codon:yes stop_codon:yes gene_type:complete